MDISSVYQALRSIFREGGMETPGLDARLLVCHACNMTHEQFVLDAGTQMQSGQKDRLDAYRERRLAGEPVSRIIGRREFWGRDFLLGPETLDPRADTETLVDAVLSSGLDKARDVVRILDLGTGTGAILLTLLAEWPGATGVGVDKSRGALDIAQKNAVLLNCQDRVSFLESSWFDSVEGRFDLVVSNPPYIGTGDIPGLSVGVAGYDPHLALDGGEDGLCAYKDIVQGLKAHLEPGGMVALELGQGQYPAVSALLENERALFQSAEIQLSRDLSGIGRCILARAGA